MKQIFKLLLLIPILVFSQSGKVIKIKDGDTIVVLDSLNKQTTIRLAEVDCPESSQAFGKNAKQFTADCVFGKTITYKVVDIDRYGRTIGKVYFDKKYLSEEIIRAGYGWWYYQYSTNKELGILEQKAKENKLGLWYDNKPTPPWEYRKTK